MEARRSLHGSVSGAATSPVEENNNNSQSQRFTKQRNWRVMIAALLLASSSATLSQVLPRSRGDTVGEERTRSSAALALYTLSLLFQVSAEVEGSASE